MGIAYTKLTLTNPVKPELQSIDREGSAPMAIEWIMRVLRAPLVATTVSLAACGTLLDPLKAPGPSKPGEIALEPSTPHSLSFRWPVAGDGNGNARVDVAYRRAGSAEWLEAYPLFRVNPDFISRDNQVSGGVLYAGSIV
ncbi:MAG TPA: hypothetical protein VLA73_11490, partial [Burkholderiales bacterium]|nr:hypothetical protein [Burkholderiales bacterium]